MKRLCCVTRLKVKQKLFEAGKINAQSLTGIAYCAFLKSSRVLGLIFETEWERFLEAECCSNDAFVQIKADKSVEAWCPEEDSNLHTLRHTDLNRARLPIPPSGQTDCLRARTLIAIG